MHRISSRSIILRALLCALVLLLALAPISGAAAATTDAVDGSADATTEATIAATATEAPAEADATATARAAENAAEQAAAHSAATAKAAAEETEAPAAQLQETTTAAADVTTQQANQDGPYTPDPNAPSQPSGNGNGNNPHDAGSKGNADGKNPPGQLPGPDDDGNNGYECDGNNGVSKGNPAHTQCPPPPPPAPRIAIDKRPTGWNGQGVETQAVPHNGTANWRITVTNTGNVALSNVRVADALAENCVRTNLGTLAVNQSVTYTCSRSNVTAAFTNSATATGTPPPGAGGDVSATDTSPVTVGQAPGPSITIDKRPLNWDGTGVETQQVAANGTANWRIAVRNNGNVSLSNVRVTDAQAANCERLGANNLGTLAVNQQVTYTCSRPNVTAGFVNSATATGTPPPGAGGDVSATDTSPVTVPTQGPNPSISIVKAHTLSPLVDEQNIPLGGTAAWMIRVTNTGNTVLQNITVTDPLAENCNRSLGTLAPGASADAYACSRGAVPAGFTNRADVVGTVPGTSTQVTAFDTAPVTVFDTPGGNPPSIQLIKTVPTPECPRPGQSLTYRFEIRNTGTQALSNIALNDPLLGGAVALPSTTLPGGQSMVATKAYTLTAGNIAAGSLSNTATVTSTGPSNQSVNNTANAMVILEDCPGEIRLDKRGPATARVGEQITYTFTVTNTGDVPLHDVRISDARLGISGLPVNPSTLQPRQQGTATATYTVTEADGDAREILNVAFVRARTPDNTEVEDDDDHRTRVPRTPEAPRPRIRLVKDGPKRASVGETITYRFTVTNTGNVTLTNVNITDPLLGLDGLTVRPSTLAPREQGTATATYVITDADAEAGSVYNTAVARGTAPDSTTVRDRDDHTVTVPLVPPGPPVCVSPPCGPPELPATGIGTTGFAMTALLSLALGGVLLGIAGSGNLQAAMANATVNADSPLLALLRQWNLAPKPGGAQARRRRRR